ncbi:MULTISPECIES: hypothetical protein [Acinetobacter]|uniref:Uncharacterized protein n=1 Tax=Acinetobacter higginsii TaxID=70347 RepID=N9SSL4_9GAMM|nr:MULTISPECIES: hypothetical protein [Acinetobacter]ENX57621.1 hypothetical protein F902_02018 [Acinetobacter higginsii]
MEQNATLDNPPETTLPFWKVLTGTMLIASGLIFGVASALDKYDHFKAEQAKPIYSQYAAELTKSSYEVMAAHLSSDITGEAVIDMDNFKVPVKFVFNSKIQYSGVVAEPVIDIQILEIGVITNMAGTNEFSDFTNFEDHKAINAAIVAYIKKHNLLEGV